MLSLKKQLQRVSSKVLRRPISVSRDILGDTQLPRNPNLVKGDIHDDAPSRLPSPGASSEEVQYFLYAVLTTKAFGCAKKSPQWVLETCWSCRKTGTEFLSLTDAEVMTLCPMNSQMYDHTDTDRKRWNAEQMPSPHAREIIGKAILSVLNDCRKNSETHKDQIQCNLESERFRERLNDEAANELRSGPNRRPTVDSLWSYRKPSYTSLSINGSESESSSDHSKFVTKITPSVSENSTQGSKDQDNFWMPQEQSSTVPHLVPIRRAGSLHDKGSLPIPKERENTKPSTMRGRPLRLFPHLESRVDLLSGTHTHPALVAPPNLSVEIPRGHMSINFDQFMIQQHCPGTNGAFSRPFSRFHCSPYASPRAFYTCPRSVHSHQTQQWMPSQYSHGQLHSISYSSPARPPSQTKDALRREGSQCCCTS